MKVEDIRQGKRAREERNKRVEEEILVVQEKEQIYKEYQIERLKCQKNKDPGRVEDQYNLTKIHRVSYKSRRESVTDCENHDLCSCFRKSVPKHLFDRFYVGL